MCPQKPLLCHYRPVQHLCTGLSEWYLSSVGPGAICGPAVPGLHWGQGTQSPAEDRLLEGDQFLAAAVAAEGF